MKAINKIKHKGTALIFVIILIVPLMFLAVWISDMVLTDFKVSSSVINYQQASYNAETGIEYGIKKLQAMEYDELFNGYNTGKYFVLDGAQNPAASGNYSETTIARPSQGVFKIESKGIYRGVRKIKDLTIYKETLLNLDRKINAGKITVTSGKVSFRMPPLGSSLENSDKILILQRDGLDKNAEIYGFTAGQGVESGIKTTGESLFYTNSLQGSRIVKISDTVPSRGQWNPGASGIEYFVTQTGSDFTINLDNISNMNDDFYTGFRNFSGMVDASGNMAYDNVRIIFVDGNVSIENIKGDFAGGFLTNAERYFNNLVIYCTGKITINNCEFIGYSGSNTPDKDLNLSLTAQEVEFVSGQGAAGGSVINCTGPNNGLVGSGKPFIIDIIKGKTSIYSNWEL